MNKAAIEGLDPANFAFIMATGVISIILYELGFPTVSDIFFVLGTICYILLFILFSVRLFLLGGKVIQEFTNPQHMFKYFTFSAGSSLLAIRFCFAGDDFTGLLLGIIGAISTIALVYALFCTLFFHAVTSIQLVSPVWLLMSIACHSTSIIISTLWNHQVLLNPFFLLLGFGFLTFGVMIYVIFMALNIYRMFFLTFAGKDINPAYWTCMGAAAIAVVDGSNLLLIREAPLFIEQMKPFIGGIVLMLWVWGTAWIPILCMMELWNYGYFKMPIKYCPPMWAIVFPLGMYTGATHLLARSVNLVLPSSIVSISLWTTIIVWLIVAGMSRFNPFRNEG